MDETRDHVETAIDLAWAAGGYGFANGDLVPPRFHADLDSGYTSQIDLANDRICLQAEDVPDFVSVLPPACADLKNALINQRIPGGQVLMFDLGSMVETYGQKTVETLKDDFKAVLDAGEAPLPVVKFFVDGERWYETLARLQDDLAPLGYACYKYAFTDFDLGEFDSRAELDDFIAANGLTEAHYQVVEEKGRNNRGGRDSTVHRLIFQAHECFLAFALDAFSFMRKARTSAPAYGLSGIDIALKLRNLDERYGLKIVFASSDSLSVVLDRAPENADEFLAERLNFDPDFNQVNYKQKLMEHNFIEFYWDDELQD